MMKKLTLNKIIQLTFVLFVFASCKSVKEIRQSYELFQTGFDSTSAFQFKELKLKVGDQINISVYSTASSDQTQIALFNVPSRSGNYILNNQGTIELPKMGTVKVEGLTCTQLRDTIKQEWSRYIKDIVVDVQLSGFTVNVMGEIGQGPRKMTSERATILDVISMSGGLSDNAKRQVLVIREDSGRRKTYTLDLRDAKIYESPAFQMQQNDVVYVNAEDRFFQSVRARNMRENIMPISQSVGLFFSVFNFIAILLALR